MANFTPVYLPQSGPNDVTATLAEWSKQPGQRVQKGEILGSAETTKSVFDLAAPSEGVFWPLAAAGSEATVGAIVAALGEEGSDHAAARAWHAAQPSAHQATAIQTGTRLPPSGPRPSTLKAELLAQRHGIDLAQVPAAGDKITEADVRAYLAVPQTAVRVPVQPATGQLQVAAAAEAAADLVDDRYPSQRAQRILIIGGGNGAVQILDVLARLPHQRAVGILDDNHALHGKQVAGVPVLGAIDATRAAEMFAAGQFDAAIISISTSISARARIFDQWKRQGIPFANVIHPSSVIGINVAWGEGNVVMAFCHFGACATIGDNNFLSAYCSIEHHCRLGSHCSFGPAVVTSSRVRIGNRVRFGTGICIEPGIEIGEGCVIASGLAITSHIPPESLLKAHLGYSIRTMPTT
jgi:sugar O-acyltransferase (sialic acid O-acetyltransferase NeuD family)